MKEELLRHCIELACTSGRKVQSPESGFVLLPVLASSSELMIPIYENMLFCLALFRSKTHEAVFEAKKILGQLLYFQQPFSEVISVGNFPLVIHDFPYCKDHLQAARCLQVLLWIYKDFHHILGQELSARLKQALSRLVSFCQKIASEITLVSWAQLKIACCLAAYAELFQEDTFFEEAKKLLPDLADQNDIRSWGDPSVLAEMIASYQLASHMMLQTYWQPLWNYLFKTWHRLSLSYVGPAYRLKYNGVGFYDYAMSLFSGELSTRANVPQEAALSCALLQLQDALPQEAGPLTYFGSRDHLAWSVYQMPSWAVSSIVGSVRPQDLHSFYPYLFVSKRLSLVIQPQKGFLSQFEGDGTKHELLFDLPADIFPEEKDKPPALCIWFDDQKETDILINNRRASCFDLKEPVQIRLGECVLGLSFQVISGDGQFIGHISRSSRSGLPAKAKERYLAPDVQLAIRVIRGSGPCQIKLEIRANPFL